MKKIYLAFITLSLLFVAISCDKDLPYPIDDVKRGVAIDIVRAAGSDGALNRGETDGNYKVKLTIPDLQGDYSFMKHAQLLAVIQGVDKKYKSVVIEDNITEFPKEITVDIASVYTKLGKTVPLIGETLYLTTNVVLQDGYVIPGWNEIIGFNNKAFAGWLVDGRAYSYSVRYPVVCPLFLEDFVGTNTVTEDEWSGEAPYDVEIIKISETELSIVGLFPSQTSNPMLLKINPVDYSISIAKQIIVPFPTWWAGNPYKDFALAGSGSIDACETIIHFTVSASVNLGNFAGTNDFTIVKKN